jgi:phenylacetate-CoA ligase
VRPGFLRLEGGILGRVDDMLIVRGVNVFPSALEGIVALPGGGRVRDRGLPRGARRVRCSSRSWSRPAVVAAVQEAVRVDLGIRVEAVSVPGQSLPRYELKARRLVRRASE